MERALSQRLREHLRLVFFDLRSSGQSGGTLGEVTIDRLLEDVDGLRGALGLEKVALLGWSVLALFAIDFAKAYPQSVSHLILIGGPARMERDWQYWEMVASPERKAILAANNERLDQAALSAVPPGRAMPLRYAADAPRYFYDPTFDPLPLYEGDEWDVPFFHHMFDRFAERHAGIEPILGVEAPTFLAQGVWDFVAPPIEWHGVIGTYRDCTYRAFERSGHYPFVEEQDLFDTKLIEWLSRQTS
jgi:proline iminopeptidase